MAAMLPCLFLLLLVLSLSWANEGKCMLGASSCDECISSGPECSWCTDQSSGTPCSTRQELKKAGCRRDNIFPPVLYSTLTINQEVKSDAPETIRLEPNEAMFIIRPGITEDFHITIFIPKDQQIPDVTLNTSYVPPGVNISFDISPQGNPRVVKVNLDVVRCPKERNMTGPWSVLIGTNVSPQKVKLQITLMCHCDCSEEREENSPACRGNGALVCGHCECYEPYFGKRCQIKGGNMSSHDDSVCRSDPGTPVCSGRGTCVEGSCQCHARANPEEHYYGRFCECSDFECPGYNNKVCGGKGKCDCQKCICDEGWTYEDCSCTMNSTDCIATNQQLCNGRGMCECGQCVCQRPFYGRTCEECPSCLGLCERTAACVECRAFGTGKMASRCDEECGSLSLSTVESTEDLPERGADSNVCKHRSSPDDCFFFFAVSRRTPGQATVVRAKQCPPPYV